ncbi:MAG: FliH/SctL family protein [Magnetococcus sp. DMHC-1]|nr:hypothetical protein [Magnetococcales bacterium]
MDQIVNSEIIRGEDVSDSIKVVRFADLVSRLPRQNAGQFIRVSPDGQIPKPEIVVQEENVQETVISADEVFQRRQENLERATFRKVFSEAEKAGMEMGRQHMEQELSLILPRLENLLRGLEALPARLYIEAENVLVETAILLVREILGYELHVDPMGLARRINKALLRMDDQKEITLAVAPADAVFLERLQDFKKLHIKGDEGISPGSFRLESRIGGMEHDLQGQLQEIEAALRSHLRERLEERMSPQGVAEALEATTTIGAEASAKIRAETQPDSLGESILQASSPS